MILSATCNKNWHPKVEYLGIADAVFLPVPRAVGPPIGGGRVIAVPHGDFDARPASSRARGPLGPRAPVAVDG